MQGWRCFNLRGPATDFERTLYGGWRLATVEALVWRYGLGSLLYVTTM